MGSISPALRTEIVAVDGKTSRRSGGVDATALHLVSAFGAGAGLVLGQRATAVKSNEITVIPQLLSTLLLPLSMVTIDAMGIRSNEKAVSKQENSSPPPPTDTVPNSSGSNDLRAIALGDLHS